MRSALARVIRATLGVSVVITLGCGSPSGPSTTRPFSVLSISPTEGSSAGGTGVVIGGAGFIVRGRAGATVTVDGKRVDASPSSDGNTISLVMPPHAAGKVDVTVTGPLGQAEASVPGGYTYVAAPAPPPPVISELLPNIGSTGGGTPLIIRGDGTGTMWSVDTVTVDGIASSFDNGWPDDTIYLSTPAHAAGRVQVIVTDRFGQAASGVFTYASPATFDFNGEWKGWALDSAASARLYVPFLLTIRDNIVVSISCDSAPSLTLDRPPVVANGEFSFAGDGVSITGKILSPNSASGSINTASCGSRQWSAQKLVP